MACKAGSRKARSLMKQPRPQIPSQSIIQAIHFLAGAFDLMSKQLTFRGSSMTAHGSHTAAGGKAIVDSRGLNAFLLILIHGITSSPVCCSNPKDQSPSLHRSGPQSINHAQAQITTKKLKEKSTTSSKLDTHHDDYVAHGGERVNQTKAEQSYQPKIKQFLRRSSDTEPRIKKKNPPMRKSRATRASPTRGQIGGAASCDRIWGGGRRRQAAGTN